MSSPRSVRRFALTALLLAPIAPLGAQGVLVAPQGIVIDHRSRSASIEVYNPGGARTEVTVSTLFGYPTTDSAGRVTLYTTETPDSTAPSAAAWVQAYPRRIMLGPNERQTVRLFARPPQGLPDGEYWTRLVVKAREAAPAATAADSGVHAGLSLEVRTIVAVWYRKGALRTTLAIDSLRPERAGDTITVRGWLTRGGSAAYVGTGRLTLEDSTGKTVAEAPPLQLAVYYGLAPRWPLATRALPPGRYTVRLAVEAVRNDLARDAIVPGAPATATATLVIPPATVGSTR